LDRPLLVDLAAGGIAVDDDRGEVDEAPDALRGGTRPRFFSKPAVAPSRALRDIEDGRSR